MEEVAPGLVEAAPIRHGMVLGGRYTIEKVLGRGGCGVVVRAHDRDLKEAVAIKIVRAELAGQQVWAERLAREVKLARQIHHPHVCRVFDFQQADGRVFLVMELATRGTVRDEVQSGVLKARPLAERIADARAVASALAAIHRAGIVHRDLTPQNLLRMGDGRVVLTDFGLATDTRDGSTSVHGGTISYMAPELLRGGRSSVQSDVWALGVVMYEIVFGERPRWREKGTPELLPPVMDRRPHRRGGRGAGGVSGLHRARPGAKALVPDRGRPPVDRARQPAAPLPLPLQHQQTDRLARRSGAGGRGRRDRGQRLDVPGVGPADGGGARARGEGVAADRPDRRARRLDGPVGGDRGGARSHPLRAAAPRSANAAVRVGDAAAPGRGRGSADPRPGAVARRARGVRRGMPGSFARRQPPALPGACAGRARLRVSLPARRRARRRSGRADRGAVDGVGADLAGRRTDVLVRRRRRSTWACSRPRAGG